MPANAILNGGMFDAVLFDCDGVLYQSDTILPGAAEAVSAFKARDVAVRIITNASGKSREQVCDKLTRLGFDGIRVGDCYPSGVCAAEYLRTNHPDVKKVYVIGAAGLVSELERVGLEVTGGPADNLKVMTDSLFCEIGEDGDVHADAVVVGYDKQFNYYKLAMASLLFQKNSKCILIATNDDINDRIGGKWLVPANGCALAAVVQAVNGLDGQLKPVKPIMVGKPNPIFGRLVLSSSGLGGIDPARVLMVGDKVDTDIRLAKNCGFKSCLVLSGCTTEDDLTRIAPEDRPDFVINGLADLTRV